MRTSREQNGGKRPVPVIERGGRGRLRRDSQTGEGERGPVLTKRSDGPPSVSPEIALEDVGGKLRRGALVKKGKGGGLGTAERLVGYLRAEHGIPGRAGCEHRKKKKNKKRENTPPPVPS